MAPMLTRAFSGLLIWREVSLRKVPAPFRVVSTPSFCSSLKHSRRVGRLTPNSLVRTGSEGSLSPGFSPFC